MLITNENYRQALKRLKKDYSDLPWYQRWWFSLWAYSLSDALSAIDLKNPTTEQVDELVKMSDESWFFNSIFGLLTQFKEAIGKLSFSGQPKEIKTEIGIRLPSKDLTALAFTSKENCAFFESLRLPNQFLHAVALGEYDKVAAMIEKDINLLLHKGPITDASGRRFFHISGFQYALWALDKHMWINILKYLPQNERGITLKAKLFQQYKELKEKGVAYELNGDRTRENHFNFKNTIIEQLEHYARQWGGHIPYQLITAEWCYCVGFAEKLLPMHVVYEFCCNSSFVPIPKFTNQPPMVKHYYNPQSGKYEDWFHSSSKLGENFAICKNKSHELFRAEATTCLHWKEAADLLDAMKALYIVRTKDFIMLGSQLTDSLPLNEHFSASPQ